MRRGIRLEISKIIPVFGLVLSAGVAEAKPLYVTVPRAYGSEESPAVEVAFAGRQPVELRVLKPENLEAFIAEQENLRRAYDPPFLLENPGRYLSRGLNALRQPGRFLRFALGTEFRSAVAPALPRGEEPGDAGRPISVLREGTEKLVGIPPGMKLVRSEWLNLDLGGRPKDYNVPGFEEWGEWGSSSYQERRLLLAPLPRGVYVLQLIQGKVEGQVLLLVSDLTMQVKQTDGEILVRVAGRDQLPKPGVEVTVHRIGQKAISGKTDPKGEVRIAAADAKLIVVARSAGDVALVDTDFYSSLAIAPDVFIYSDRPIYRPGDNVRFRGVIRKPDSFLARLFRPKKREVEVSLVSQAGTAATSRAPVDEFGSFHGELVVPTGLDTGVLRLFADLDGHEHQSEARVQEYVKPTFYLEIATEKDSIKPGDVISAKVRARRYSGGVPAGARYEVFLYRTLVDTPSWVDDAGMGGKGSAVTYGSKSTTEGGLSVPRRLYSSVAERMEKKRDLPDQETSDQKKEEDPWSTAERFDAAGNANISVTVPVEHDEGRIPFRYTLTVRARDDQGTFANVSKTFFFAESEVMGLLLPSAKLVLAGAPATLSVRATTLGGRPFGESKGEVELTLETADGRRTPIETKPFQTGADGIWRMPMPTQKIGTVFAKVTLNDRAGHPWVGEASMLVAGKGGEMVIRVPALSVDALKGVLEPDDQADLVALFPDSWGPNGKNQGKVWLTLSGASIFESSLIDVTGMTLVHRFDIERRFGSAVYASIAYPTASGRWEERTVPFRIVPSERTLRVKVNPVQLEAAPLGKQTIELSVTDHAGRPVQAEVSVGVVDKAIYALQSEFRPEILEFFYPLGRNNLMSFYSTEFQGYGYGEAIARLGPKVRPYEFAAIKPPTRRPKDQDRDTAYWNPAIATDRDGRASVTFTLPSNQTLWTVTAVAADASGRFGESTSEFATRGALSVVASVPQFLRQGDRATGKVRVSRGKEGPDTIDLDLLALAKGAATSAPLSTGRVQLAKDQEQVVTFDLEAKEAGRADLLVGVKGGPSPLSADRGLDVRRSVVSDTIVATAWGGGDLSLDLPKDASAENVELVLEPSIVGASMLAVRDLLEYPYGCLEQLVSTTMPNVAVYRTLEKVEGLGGLDPESKALLAEARSRAVQGVQRILQLEVKGGGFTWFSGYKVPSTELTMIALDGLAYAIEAGLVDRTDPRIIESEAWLSKAKGNLPFELEATRTYVLSRLEGKKAAARVRALIESARPGDLYSLALAVLAAENAGIQNETGSKERVAALVEMSRDGLAKVATYQPSDEVFWHYPMRQIGISAILAHAASFGELDVGPVRQRVIRALANPAELSTFDKSTVLLHSLWLIERDAKALRDVPPPAVEVGGVRGEKARLVRHGTGYRAELPAGTRSARIDAFDGVAKLTAHIWTPVQSVAPFADGMSISRSYYVLRSGKKELLSFGKAVNQGEEVFVELTINAHEGDRNWHRSAYYVVEDHLPAGFEPLVEDKVFRGAPYSLELSHEALRKRSVSPEHVTFFFEEPAWWSRSPRRIGYVMRAQFAGRFLAPPATVEDMYAARVKGRTEGATLEVTASKADERK